jgi:chromosome segregation ATPase
LEDKAVTAGTAAIEAKKKLDRLKSSILNTGYLFDAAKPASSTLEEDSHASKSRKRRQSDGALFLRHASPTKADITDAATPNTIPKKRKQKAAAQHTLSPTSELSIVRKALSSRTELTRVLQTTVEEYTQLLHMKDAELAQTNAQHNGLKQAGLESNNEIGSLRRMLASLRSEFDEALSDHQADLAEKESTVNDSLKTLEEGIREREELKLTNARLENDINSLREALNAEKERFDVEKAEHGGQMYDFQKRFDALEEERVRGAFEVAQCTTEMEKLLVERDSDKHDAQPKGKSCWSNVTLTSIGCMRWLEPTLEDRTPLLGTINTFGYWRM